MKLAFLIETMRLYTYSKIACDVVHNSEEANHSKGLIVLTQAYPSIIVGT